MDQETKQAFLNLHELLLETLDVVRLQAEGRTAGPDILSKLEETRQHIKEASTQLGL